MRLPWMSTVALFVGALALIQGISGSPAAGAASKRAASVPEPDRSILPWIEDDFERALAEAKERTVPLFVESWAPW